MGKATVLTCWRCDGRLQRAAGRLTCPRKHSYALRDGFYDLWPDTHPEPTVDVFSTPYGVLYDTGIKERSLARIAGRLGWAADPRPIFDLMDAGVVVAPGEVVLDVPVGGAPTLRAAAGRMRGTYIGVDLSPAMLRRAAAEVLAEELEDAMLVRADATEMPIGSNTIDRALSFNGLHVMPDKRGVLQELHRVLLPGGELWGSAVVVDANSPQRWLAGRVFHPAREDELEPLARQAGFKAWTQTRAGNLLTFRATA